MCYFYAYISIKVLDEHEIYDTSWDLLAWKEVVVIIMSELQRLAMSALGKQEHVDKIQVSWDWVVNMKSPYQSHSWTTLDRKKNSIFKLKLKEKVSRQNINRKKNIDSLAQDERVQNDFLFLNCILSPCPGALSFTSLESDSLWYNLDQYWKCPQKGKNHFM